MAIKNKNTNGWTVMVRSPSTGRIARCKQNDVPVVCETEEEAQALAKKWRDGQSMHSFGGGNHYWAEEI